MNRKNDLNEATERVKTRLQVEAGQYVAMAEPLVVMQYIFFRSLIQEAHMYALIDQWASGKLDVAELQKRFVDHADRIASQLGSRRGIGQIARLVKKQ